MDKWKQDIENAEKKRSEDITAMDVYAAKLTPSALASCSPAAGPAGTQDWRKKTVNDLFSIGNLKFSDPYSDLTESRFWTILNNISNADHEHQTWTQKILQRELVCLSCSLSGLANICEEFYLMWA